MIVHKLNAREMEDRDHFRILRDTIEERRKREATTTTDSGRNTGRENGQPAQDSVESTEGSDTQRRELGTAEAGAEQKQMNIIKASFAVASLVVGILILIEQPYIEINWAFYDAGHNIKYLILSIAGIGFIALGIAYLWIHSSFNRQ